MKRIIGTILTAAAMAIAPALSASAATQDPTVACAAVPRCVAVDVHGPLANTNELALTHTTLTVNAAVTVTAGPAAATPGAATQDWISHRLGRVPTAIGNKGAYNFSAYDNANYGGDAVYSLEAAPSGVASGLCLANINRVAVLRHCNGSRWQAFIRAGHVDGFSASPIDPDGSFGLTVLHSSVRGHHRGLKAVDNAAATQLQFRAVHWGLGNSNWDNEDLTG